MKKNDIVRVTIERLTPDGKGFANIEGRAVHVRGALPGDVVDVRIMGLKRHSARVRVEGIVENGIERVDARCRHFEKCGGCVWQNVPYGEQCRLKAELVCSALGSVPGLDAPDEIEFISSPDLFFYRNKMEFTFDCPPGSGGEIRLGLHEAGRYNRVFNLKDCLLQSGLSNRIVGAARDFASENELTAYGLKTHAGLLRFLMVRDGKNTGDLMVNLVTSGEDFPLAEMFSGHIAAVIPEVTTVIRSINRGRSSVAVGEEQVILRGEGLITDRIGEFIYNISPNSFFQTNTSQALNLYDTIRSFCGLDGSQSLLDLYCGTGTIGIFCAEGAAEVTGVESVEEAVLDARKNAELNGVSNCTFISGQVENIVDESMGDFDVVVCDPPRPGIHPGAMNKLLYMRIPRMVYVSCNLKALPADFDMLSMAGYRIRQVRAFDMSPHTPHIETVVLLEIE